MRPQYAVDVYNLDSEGITDCLSTLLNFFSELFVLLSYFMSYNVRILHYHYNIYIVVITIFTIVIHILVEQLGL